MRGNREGKERRQKEEMKGQKEMRAEQWECERRGDKIGNKKIKDARRGEGK